MKSMKLKITTLLSLICLFVCAVMMGIMSSIGAFAEETVNTFAGTKIIGAQVRLDGNNALRFVIEMDEADYQAYVASHSAEKENEEFIEQYDYQLGVLVIPTELLDGGDLTKETEKVVEKLFPTDYDPKKVTKNDVKTYRFNAALDLSSDAAKYAKDITARAYIQATNRKTDKKTFTYLDAYSANSSKLASKFYATDEANQNAYASYVLKALSEVDGTNYTSVEELANIDLGLYVNEINTILVGETVNGYSNQLTMESKYDNILDIDVSVEDEYSSIDENNVITGLKLGTSTVKASILGGAVADTLNYDVFDNVMYEVGNVLAYETDETGHKMLAREDGKISRNASQTATTNLASQFHTFQQYTASGGKIWVESGCSKEGEDISSDGVDGYTNKDGVLTGTYDGREGTFVQANVDARYTTYWTLALPYTKDQIKMFLDAGYVNVNVPMHVGVSSDALNSWMMNEGNRNYFNLITPTTLVDKTVDKYDGFNGKYQRSINQGKIYVNQWTDIQLSLQFIYENFEKFSFKEAEGTITVDNSVYTMFGIDLGMERNQSYNNSQPMLKRTFTIGDITLTKEKAVADNVLNTSNADTIRNSIWAGLSKWSNNKSNNLSAYTTNDEINGRTAVGGNFIAVSNAVYGYGGHGSVASLLEQSVEYYHYDTKIDTTNAGTTGTCASDFYFYLDLENVGWSKEYLQGLKNAGKTSLKIDVSYIVDAKKNETTTAPSIIHNGTGNKMESGKTTPLTAGGWSTVNIDIDKLINSYDSYNKEMQYNWTGTTEDVKHPLLKISQDKTTITTFFMDNFRFE